MKKIFRNVFCLMMTCFLFAGLSLEVIAAEEKNTIAIVYDDSGSMMYDGNQDKVVDRWCHAKYALEVFSTMMLEDDVINVYPMNNKSAGFTMKGSDDAEKRRKQVEDFEIIYGGYTPYQSITDAYAKVSSVNDGSTRWLLVITDGDFGVNYSQVNDVFEQYTASGVNVVYLRIYDNANAAAVSNDRNSKVINQPEKNIFVYEAMKSKDTLARVNEISNLIFKRQALSKYPGVLSASGKSLVMNLDVPVSQLVVFAQGENIQAGEITGPKTVKRISAINVKTPDMPTDTGGIPREQMLVADGLGGVVATYVSGDKEPLPAGVYTLDISDTSNVEVYCKLAVNVEVVVTQNGESVEGADNIYVGDYEMTVVLKDPITGQVLDSSAKLLSDAEYDIKVTNTYIDENGEEQVAEKIFDEDSFKDSVVQGNVDIEGTIKLGDSYVSVSEGFGVVPELENLQIQYTVPQDGINFEELDQKASAITVKVLEEGQPLSETQAENLEFHVTTDKKVNFDIVPGSEPGEFLIYPMYQGTIDSTDSGNIPFRIEATLEMDGQKKSVEENGTVELYINLLPIDITFTVPVPEGKEEPGYVIENLSYTGKDSNVQSVVLNEKFEYIIADYKIDGRDFTKEEWDSARIEAYLVDAETGERIEGEKFSIKYEKGTGDQVSKVLIAPVSHVKNIYWYLFAKDISVEVSVAFDYLGSTCKDTARTDCKIFTAGMKLIIHWLPIIIVLIASSWLIWSMTFGKCWNKPKPEFVIKRWNYPNGDAPEIVKTANVTVHSFASLLPRRPVIWRISSGDGMCAVVLQATPNGYVVLNTDELLKRNVQRNFTTIPPGTKKITVTNTAKLSVRTRNTAKEKSDTILYLHKRDRKKNKAKPKSGKKK